MIVPVTATIVAQAAATTAPASSDAAVAARAQSWLHAVQNGKIDRSQLDDKMNAALTDAKLAAVAAKLAPLGEPKSFTLERKADHSPYRVYVYKVAFAKITLLETFTLDAAGKIAGFFLTRP
jgi:hypothetical protein